MASVAESLGPVPGVRHVSVADTNGGGSAVLVADVQSDAGDRVLSALEPLGLPRDSVTLLRFETVGPATEPLVLVWTDILSQARARAEAPVSYVVSMTVAGVVGAFGIVNKSAILIVGAMAISPDLLPITAVCTGLVLRRHRLVGRGLATLFAGFALAGIAAALIAAFLDAIGSLPDGFTVQEIPAAQTHVSVGTVIVALAAGIAGMLAVETRAGSAVGVAISVTTIPAIAYLGVAVGIGELDKAWSAFGVLIVNVTMMLLGGSSALAAQRLAATRRAQRG
jgi:uncharacterized hydrophobic protein (TIGR00271 family)